MVCKHRACEVKGVRGNSIWADRLRGCVLNDFRLGISLVLHRQAMDIQPGHRKEHPSLSQTNTVYRFQITLKDGSAIQFRYVLTDCVTIPTNSN